MNPLRARAMRWFGLVLAFAGCTADEPGCVEAEVLWHDPPPGDICVIGDLVIEGRGPQELAVVARVEEIAGSLVIDANPELIELPEWSALVRIGGSLSISNNPGLTAVRGFPVLAELPGGIYVAENPALRSFVLGGAVTTVESLFFALNPALTEVRGMGSLERVAGDVQFVDNAGLTVVTLPWLAEAGTLTLTGNPALRTLDFPALRSVEKWSLVRNDALESLAGFGALERARMAIVAENANLREIAWEVPDVGWVAIEDNPRLERIDGSSLALSASGSLFVRQNPALRSITGFDGVEELGVLAIEDNDRLREIAGFGSLAWIGGIEIVRNPALEGPHGWFPGLAAVLGNVAVYGNASLAPATVDELLERIGVAGEIRTGDNRGQETALEPCPWPQDGICDDVTGWYGSGTGLCAADPEDCDDTSN